MNERLLAGWLKRTADPNFHQDIGLGILQFAFTKGARWITGASFPV